MAEINDNEQVGFRKAKRSAIIESGIAPYPTRLKTTTTIKEIIKNYSDKNLEKGEETADVVSIAGRIMHIRNAGKLIFAAIQDGEHNRLQIMLNAQKLDKSKYATDDDLVNGEGRELSVGESSIKVFKRLVDLGDHIYVTGNVINSLTGELSVLVTDWEIAAKSIRPLPVLHKELSDEQRTRRRYLDMIVSKTSRHLVSVRSGVMKSLRNTFDGYNYMEIETPMLQLIHGGASARPFTTHANAIDTDLYLRIAPELFLKRAVVGGIERVFEINRNFRNEGMDSSHSPEFAMLEAYETYGNYDTMAELTKKLVQNACMDVFGTLEVQIIAENAADSGQDSDGGTDSEETAQNTVTYSFADDQWQKISLYESLSEALGENVTPDTDIETLKKFAKKHNLEKEVLKDEKHLNAGKLVELLWEELVGNDLYKPTFVYDFPEITSPLTSAHPDKPGVAQKWDLIVRGFELATAYSELVDPVIQRERLTAQSLMAAGGDAEAMQLDTDFIEALEYGMPPSGGMGMGVDRLLMAITGYGIRDTITFPLIKNA